MWIIHIMIISYILTPLEQIFDALCHLLCSIISFHPYTHSIANVISLSQLLKSRFILLPICLIIGLVAWPNADVDYKSLTNSSCYILSNGLWIYQLKHILISLSWIIIPLIILRCQCKFNQILAQSMHQSNFLFTSLNYFPFSSSLKLIIKIRKMCSSPILHILFIL